ncbi:MAG: filamentous hemagglutinin N-terminal domain-containing protein [Betaproteobacteria bacterium]|nr:filamentous hemagglutinin N-terminal domain-containing protein [Betaproteobacteria bacterium]
MKTQIRPLPTKPPGDRSSCGKRAKRNALMPKALALAVASCFAADLALANPSGFAVVNGQVVFNYNGQVLTITNTPGSIINWQSFSIGVNEITRFIQQSAASAVLNRVIGIDPSIILGALQSNGRVFLINPNGILFGAGAQIDVAGLVASTLNLSNADFLAGRLRFTDTPGAGSLVNQGAITTPTGGQVYLIAPNVENTGIITSPQGEVILAAGRSVELVDAGTPNLRVEITAPDTEALNVGQIIANSGKIGIYAGLIRNSGVIKADGVVVGQNGEILLRATQNTTLDAGGVISASGTANGVGGGNITVEGGTVTNAGTVQANAADNATAGNISMVAQNDLTLASTSRIEARGADVNSNGGTVYLYGFGDAYAQNGQVIDLSGGLTSGNGGNGEFSAAHTAMFSGTLLGNAASGYQRGSFIIDPFDAFVNGIFSVNTTVFAQNNVTIDGAVSIDPAVTLTLLADHNSTTIGDWHDGIGAIINGGGFTITGAGGGSSTLAMYAAGGGIGTALAPILTEMNGGSIVANTNNPAQVGAADTFITNGFSDVNIAGFDDGINSNNFLLTTGGRVDQTGQITVSGFAFDAGDNVELPLFNMVGTLAGRTSDGNITFINAQSLTIGSVAGINGLSANGSSAAINVTVTGAGNNLTVNQPVNAFSSYYRAKVNLSVPAGTIWVNNDVTADNTYGDYGAEVTLNAGSGINVSNATVSARGWGSYYGPNNVSVALTTTTGDIEISNNSTVSAEGASGAAVTLNAGTGISISNSTVKAFGWGFGNPLSVALTTTTGDIEISNNSTVSGSNNNSGGASVALTATAGGIGITDSTVSADSSDGATVTLDASTGITMDNSLVRARSWFGLPAAISLTTTGANADISVTNSNDGNGIYIDGGEGGIIALDATGNIMVTSSVISASGSIYRSGSFDLNAPVAEVKLRSDKVVTITDSTLSAAAGLQIDGGEGGHTVNLNAPLAMVNITGGDGVKIEDAPATISANANLSINGWSGAVFDVNVNDSVAAVNITGTGTGLDSGVRITGSAITVAANLSAQAYSTSAAVNLNVAAGAPVAAVNITGSGVNGVTIDSSSINVTGNATAYASYYGSIGVGGTMNAPLAAVYITGTGTGAATSGVTITGATITVSGQMNALARSSAAVDINNTVNAPLAQAVIAGSGGTVNGVTITGSTIEVRGSMNAGNSESYVTGVVNFNGELNAPLASLNISSGNGVSIDGADITVSGAFSGYDASGGSTVNFNGTVNAPLAQIGISGDGGEVNGVTLANSSVTADAQLSGDGGEGSVNFFTVFNQPQAAVVNVASTAGNINIPDSNITASADDQFLGLITSKILLQTTNGYILGDADSLLTASYTPWCMGCDPNPVIELRATSGIGALGNPIIFADDQADIIAVNSGATGDVALAQATGDVIIDLWSGGVSNISNSAPGGAIDLTALGGNFTVQDTVSNPNGSLTLRSALAGGYIAVDGGEGGMLTTGSGAFNDITLIADDVALISGVSGPVVQSGSGFVNVRTFTAGREIWLGSSGFGAGQLELDNAELNNMTALGGAGGGLVIGVTGGAAGALVFKGAVDSSAFLNVRGSTITQDPGATITGGLNVVANTNVTLTDAGNQIDYFTTGSNVGGNISLVTSTDVGLYGVSATGNVSITSSGAITNPIGEVFLHAGGTTALNAATGIGTAANPIRIDMGGAGFSATNSTSGDVAVTSSAPTFTVGAGGASFSNGGGGGYYISALNNMQLNGGTANDGYAQFAAGDTLTVNGYSNPSGSGVLMLANNVTFSGSASDVFGALGVIGGTINVNANVEGGSIDVVANTLNVNGADFDAFAGNFTGYISGDITVAGGGRIYGSPDVDLTVGGTIFINDPGSKIEAGSPVTIHVLFPLLSEGGYLINGAPVVWDELTGTGFFADGLPAVLGQNLLIDYGLGAGALPPDVIAAINTLVDATNKSGQSQEEEEEEKKEKEKEEGNKPLSKGLELQCK